MPCRQDLLQSWCAEWFILHFFLNLYIAPHTIKGWFLMAFSESSFSIWPTWIISTTFNKGQYKKLSLKEGKLLVIGCFRKAWWHSWVRKTVWLPFYFVCKIQISNMKKKARKAFFKETLLLKIVKNYMKKI